jgi:non-homologous end joining protein Ku
VRPYWKGYLKLALVSCPIALHAACSTAERIAFRQVNKATGNRLRQHLIDEETGAVVAPQDRGRGYEFARGKYLIVADEELQAIEIASTHTIEIDSFVPLRYPDEVRKAEDYFCDLPDLTIAPDMLTLAGHIVDSKAADFDPVSFRDRYEEALLAHLKAKQAGAVQQRKPTVATPHRVINLMEALRRSVAEDKKLAALRRERPRRANGHECHAGARQ